MDSRTCHKGEMAIVTVMVAVVIMPITCFKKGQLTLKEKGIYIIFF